MKTSKVVTKRRPPQTPAEFHAVGASLDRELSVVRSFARKRGFVAKARIWKALADWESRRALAEAKARSGNSIK
jgi:hypothetical protein